MNSFSELQEAVKSDLTIGDESTLFPLATVKQAINRAYRKVGGLFRWPDLEDAKKTSTGINQEYYDYPQNWRPNSIFRLEVDGTQYGEPPDGSPMVFEDYLIWRNDSINANSTLKKWSNQWRRYFIYPIPTTNGSFNITVWGQENVEELINDIDVTIFSYSQPECNEAIVLESVAILRAKGEDQKVSQLLSGEAKGILALAWNRIKQDRAKYEKNQPFFDVPDFFGENNRKIKQIIGNF